MNTVITPSPIHCRLRIDCQITQFVHLGELIIDDRSLGCGRLGRPGEFLEISSTESSKECTDVGKSGWVTP
jgi:hypothetical protein